MKKLITFTILLFIAFTLSNCKKEELQFKLNPGIDTVELGQSWIDAGASALYINNYLKVTVSHEVDTNVSGEYIVQYKVNHMNKDYIIERYVFVVDQTPPTAVLNPGIDTIIVGSEWVDAGVETYDLSGQVEVVVIGQVNTEQVGTYTITYRLSDSSGNTSEVERMIKVIN